VAALEIDRADALLKETRSASLPYLTANGGYTRLDNYRRLGNQHDRGQEPAFGQL